MHLGTAALLRFFDLHRNDEALVLVTITGTEGSTYRKPGAMMLISRDGAYEGMISGGCLEGDLLHHANKVFESGVPKSVTYDMHAGEDLVWGLGLGCDGIIHLQLQRLDRGAGFALLDFLRETQSRHEPAMMALVTRSGTPGLEPGSFGLFSPQAGTMGDARLSAQCSEVVASAGGAWPRWRHQVVRNADVHQPDVHQPDVHQHGADVMFINIPPVPRVLLCGGGPDAVPVARLVSNLGWSCVIADHRSGFARADRFPAGSQVVLTRPDGLAKVLDLDSIDAAVVMSHHLENDAAYLRQLAPHVAGGRLRFIGVLGPAARRHRLQEMAGCPGLTVHGPAGLDVGAELPEAIALSILAEIHAVLNQRDGQSLTTGPKGTA